MPKFIMAYYHSGKTPASPEEGAAQMERYMNWMMAHQDALIEPQNPLKNKKYITSDGINDGGKDGSMMGYTIIQAADISAAQEIAQTCPFLDMGDIELAELIQM